MYMHTNRVQERQVGGWGMGNFTQIYCKLNVHKLQLHSWILSSCCPVFNNPFEQRNDLVCLQRQIDPLCCLCKMYIETYGPLNMFVVDLYGDKQTHDMLCTRAYRDKQNNNIICGRCIQRQIEQQYGLRKIHTETNIPHIDFWNMYVYIYKQSIGKLQN